MIRFLTSVCLMAASLSAGADPSPSSGPFQGVDLGALDAEQQEVIIQASEDFERVQSGRLPRHAVRDEKAPVPADGGTQFFNGKRYKLTVVKSLSSFGTLHGYVYGPVISFDKSFAPGNRSELVGLRFYTREQFKQLESRDPP